MTESEWLTTEECRAIKESAGDGMIYLASPYSAADEAGRLERFKKASRAAGRLFSAGYKVFSPIAHTHPIAVDYDRWFIERCSCVVVLVLKGWDESAGVKAEMGIAKELGKPIRWMSEC